MDRKDRLIVGLMGSSHAFNHGFLLLYPAVLLLLQEEFSVGYLGLGIIGNIMGFSYGLGALPGGMIYNRLGAKKLYLLCFLGTSASLVMVAAADNLLLFTAGLAVMGILGSIYHPLANALITSTVKEFGKGIGIHGSAGNIGMAVAPFLAGLIASHLGWRHVYLWFAIPGVLLSLWAVYTDMSPRQETPQPAPAKQGSTEGPRRFGAYFTPPLLCLYTANMLNSFGFLGSMTFLPTYMAKRTHFQILGMDNVALGGMLSGIVLFMGVFGQYIGGILAQRPELERKFLLLSLAAFPFSLFMSFATDSLLVVLALFFFFFNFFLQPMNNVLLARYTAVEMRGTAFGIFFFIAFGFGSVASSLSGWVAQRFGLQWVFTVIAGSGFLLIFFAFLLWRLKESARR